MRWSSASSPRMTCRINGARMPASMAGCAQANISASRRSGISAFRGSRAHHWRSAPGPRLPGRCWLSPGHIDQLAPGNGQQPRFRVRRDSPGRPVCQRRREGLRQRILGGSHIVRACGKKGDQLAVAAARNRVRRAARLLVAFTEGMAGFSSRSVLQIPCSAGLRHAPDRANLDHPMTGAWAARCPRERGIQIGHVDQIIAAQLLL